MELSADRPLTDPNEDLFGHAPFARHLAHAIRRQKGSDGIVLALYGPWGAGKSTVLAYVQHYLDQAAPDERPVTVSFNPWWFSGQESLAKAFLGQLQATLHSRHAGFKPVAKKLGAYAQAIAESGNAAARSPHDVQALKSAVSAQLRERGKRVLVVVDDIDRLAPDEVRELFTVIKALADFPYVTYLLAFDREVASTAISEQTGLPGERYIEKIIQVPFELPQVDRETLRRALFTRLDAAMAATPAGRFDSAYWANVFFTGLDPLFQVPRDIVRLVNSLNVTYPAVVGEVNPVDFIAIECLRVFLPVTYDAIRTDSSRFTGHRAPNGDDRHETIAFHEAWLGNIPQPLRESTKALMQRLFPRLDSIWGGTTYAPELSVEWRRQLRVCSPDVFPAFFRLSLPEGSVSRAEIEALLELRRDEAALAGAFRRAAQEKGPDGVSRVRSLLERFMDHVPGDMTAADAGPVIRAFMAVGDALIVPGDRARGGFDFGNESRVGRIVYHLLRKLEPGERLPMLIEAMYKGSSLRCSQYIVGALANEAEKAERGEGEALVPMNDVITLKRAWRHKINEAAASPRFIHHPSLADLLSGWKHWDGEADARAWWARASRADEGLLQLIAAHGWESNASTGGERAVRTRLRVDPKGLETYGDVQQMAERVSALLARGTVSEQWRPAAEQFVRECRWPDAGRRREA